ncbi:hypothetical protein AB6A40_006348 [Gnathostoma spinigerum]|uniref:Aminopeptidase n=1 Tax=Gnathostoma spinigerum TaxID=75299 RepID=A0ABD6EQT0_9BILA
MNSERASLKNRRREEIEPCLRADNQSLGVLQDSLPSRLSFIAVKGTDYIGRCVLFLFILAIFLLAVVLAFLVGHWLARNDPFFESTTPSSLNVTTTRNAAVLTITEAVHSNDKENWLEENDEQSLTLLDVYVPSNIEITMWPPLHLATTNNNKKRRNILLTALPRHILPVHYDLLLDLTTFAHSNKIRGNISILLESYGNSTKNEIVFHAASTVHIDRLRVHHEGRPVMIESLHRDYRKKIVRIITKERLRSGWHTLEVQFVTRLCDDDDVSGVHCYRNGAANSKNDNKTLPVISFTTKFEPTLARTFIPCWDEPSVKATFNVSVIHQPTITVLSNMPPYRMQQNKRRRNVITSFHRTPPMSVYLLAFAAGSFMRLETSTQRNIPLTIWTLREDFIHARFAANFSPSMFDKHEREFEIKYPLPKLDFVVARSFPVGGMENWGLIIFHNDMILLDSFLEDYVNMTVDLMAERFKIEKIITHEIAHQWFGNLVTMDDWSEIWLNEGFASFYVHDFLSRDYPNLASSEYYLRLTQLVTRQTMDEKFALVRHLRSESEVENAFDRIHLYTKGCVIVKMMMDLVKEAPFRAGVRRYLKRNAYKAVSRDALWDAMPPFADHGAENLRLEDVIDPWLINEGIPEVVISRNYNEDSVKVTQRASDQNQYVIFLTDVNLNYNEQIHHSNDRLRRDNQNTDTKQVSTK